MRRTLQGPGLLPASPRLLARQLALAVLALIGIGVAVAAAMLGLILLLYAPR